MGIGGSANSLERLDLKQFQWSHYLEYRYACKQASWTESSGFFPDEPSKGHWAAQKRGNRNHCIRMR